MDAARSGDRAALDVLLRRHHDRIWSVCRRMCRNEADALDATQEALITIARRLDRFDGRSTFSTWVYRVTVNACLDELRRRRRRPEPVDVTSRVDGGNPEQAHAWGADESAPVDARDALDRALALLPPEFRAPVVLRDLHDLDYAEIAAVLDIPIGTVRSRIARGRAHLARTLGGNRTTTAERPTDHPPARPNATASGSDLTT